MDGVFNRPKGIFSFLKFYVRKISFMSTDRIITADQTVKELLSKNYGIDEGKFAIIPMGANIDLFHPMDKYRCREISGFDGAG